MLLDILEQRPYQVLVFLLKRIKDGLPYFFALDDVTILKFSQLLGHGWHRYPKHITQITNAQFTFLHQKTEHFKAGFAPCQA